MRGYDLNAGALGTARRNARRAGVTLALERHDLRTLKAPPDAPGLVVANPPYGKRVGEVEDLAEEVGVDLVGRAREQFDGVESGLRRAVAGEFQVAMEDERTGLGLGNEAHGDGAAHGTGG